MYCGLYGSISIGLLWARHSPNIQEESSGTAVNSAEGSAMQGITPSFSGGVFEKARNEWWLQKASKIQSKNSFSFFKVSPFPIYKEYFLPPSAEMPHYKSMATRHVWPSRKVPSQQSSSTTTYSSPTFFILNLTIKYFPLPESIYCQKAIFCFALIIQISKKRKGKERKGRGG